MKAVRIHEHGGPEVLRLEEAPPPRPGPHEALVRVRAVALNHIDVWVRRGLPRLRVDFPHTLGADIAGEIAALGGEVGRWKIGDAVLLHPGVSCGHCEACTAGLDNRCGDYSILGEHIPGGYAEYITVPQENLLPKPPHLSFEEAAAMPLVFLTAWNMLVSSARLRFGEDVLVWGAGSGVGSAGIQIARLFAARVITTAGAAWKLDRARELGADVALNYRERDVLEEVRRATARRGVDVVLDHVGAATWGTSINALAAGGRLTVCGVTSGPQTQVDIRYIYARQLTIVGTWMGTKAEMREILRLIERRRLAPVVYAVLPLGEAAEAHRIMEESRHFGKIVLQVS